MPGRLPTVDDEHQGRRAHRRASRRRRCRAPCAACRGSPPRPGSGCCRPRPSWTTWPHRARPAWRAGRPGRSASIVPFVTRWFFASVVQGAEELLREAGYDLLLYNLGGDQEARHRVFRTHLLRKRVDAVLVLSLTPTDEEVAALARLERPVAVVGATVAGWASVRIDDDDDRPDRDAAPARPRPPPDRLRRRLLEDQLDFAAPLDRLNGYRAAMDGGRAAGGPVLGGRRRLHRPRRPRRDPAAAGGRPAADGGLRGLRRDGGRRGARRCARPGCGCPRTSRSSASTTTRWPSSSS